ncbi:hypothetical protein Syun_017642 [Stephania yunnanensis]|uniref:Uncharacterized protein n=1 Tax=Stephania yunnanensis TaxID=152371 RepID=A0AAP0P5B0_9MAGN
MVNDRDQVTLKQRIGASVVVTLHVAQSYLKDVSVKYWYCGTKSASTTPNPFGIISSLKRNPKKHPKGATIATECSTAMESLKSHEEQRYMADAHL